MFSRFQGAWVLFYRDRLVRISISHYIKIIEAWANRENCIRSSSSSSSSSLFLSMHAIISRFKTELTPSFVIKIKCNELYNKTGRFAHTFVRKRISCHRTDGKLYVTTYWLFSAIWGVWSTCCLSKPHPLSGGVLSQGFISYYCFYCLYFLPLSRSTQIDPSRKPSFWSHYDVSLLLGESFVVASDTNRPLFHSSMSMRCQGRELSAKVSSSIYKKSL